MNKVTKILLSVGIVSLSALIMSNYSNVLSHNNKISPVNTQENEIIANKVYAKNKSINKYNNGWVIADCVNIRERPSTNSKIIGHAYFNDKFCFANTNKNWVEIIYKNNIFYIHKKYISKNKPSFESYNTPYTNGMKTFMPYMVRKNGKYRSVFSESSKQYKLQQYCYTREYGIRQYKNRFCVALGSTFGLEIGQYFDLLLDNGEVIQCIMADQKADEHTDSSNTITIHNGCMSEFIVDSRNLNSNARRMGDVSYCTDSWKSRVVKVKVYKKCVDL